MSVYVKAGLHVCLLFHSPYNYPPVENKGLSQGADRLDYYRHQKTVKDFIKSVFGCWFLVFNVFKHTCLHDVLPDGVGICLL